MAQSPTYPRLESSSDYPGEKGRGTQWLEDRSIQVLPVLFRWNVPLFLDP
jgi:hypothetical protein